LDIWVYEIRNNHRVIAGYGETSCISGPSLPQQRLLERND